MEKIDLHLVSWLRPKMTELVIKTIARNTDRGHYRLVVWDNGSDEETQAMLSHWQDNGLIDELLLHKTNVGLETARNNMLYEHTFSKYFVCVDNDCLPQPRVDGVDWLERLYNLIEENPEYGAISCRTQVMVGTGNIFEESDVNGDPITQFPHPGGSLRIMNTEITRKVGGWHTERSGRGTEERHICGLLNEEDYLTGFATFIPTYHLFGTREGTGEPQDRWGYPADWKPQVTGHSDVYHPALENGDDLTEVTKYAGEEYAQCYFATN